MRTMNDKILAAIADGAKDAEQVAEKIGCTHSVASVGIGQCIRNRWVTGRVKCCEVAEEGINRLKAIDAEVAAEKKVAAEQAKAAKEKAAEANKAAKAGKGRKQRRRADF